MPIRAWTFLIMGQIEPNIQSYLPLNLEKLLNVTLFTLCHLQETDGQMDTSKTRCPQSIYAQRDKHIGIHADRQSDSSILPQTFFFARVGYTLAKKTLAKKKKCLWEYTGIRLPVCMYAYVSVPLRIDRLGASCFTGVHLSVCLSVCLLKT